MGALCRGVHPIHIVVMVILHIVILLLLAICCEAGFGSEQYQNWLWRLNLDRKPLSCKSCLTFWGTFLYSWLFLFSLSWALVTGFVFFTLSIEEYTERFIGWIKKLKK